MNLGIILQITQNAAVTSDSVARAVNPPVVTAPPAQETLSLLDMLIKGGWVMVPIAILSLVAVYVFFERFFAIRKALREETNFMNNIRDFIYNGRIDSAIAICKSTNKPIARMIEKGIMRLGRPVKEIEESIEIVGKFEIYKLEKNLVILAIIAGVAPMFGFVGTIIGIIKIFHDISLSGDVTITAVSSGLYTKMVTSAAGLIVGIFAFICYHWLNILVDKIVHKLEFNAMNFIDLLQEPSK